MDATQYLPTAPSRILIVGEPADTLAERATAAGHDVVAKTPDEWRTESTPTAADGTGDGEAFDAIVLDHALARFPDLDALFERCRAALGPGTSRLIVIDHVSVVLETHREIGHHPFRELSRAHHAAGFHVRRHERNDAVKLPTLDELTALRPPLPSPGSAAAPGSRSGSGTAAPLQEMWDLRPSDVRVRPYASGDEAAILEAFREIFQDERTPEHWRWKFADCPFGTHKASSAWDGALLVGHYAGYPLPLWLDGRNLMGLHAGDTMTRPSHRGVGRGKTSILARTNQQFEAEHGVGRIPFAWGFNTTVALRFGQLFLGYEAADKITVRALREDVLAGALRDAETAATPRRFSVRRTTSVGLWADLVFRRARKSLGWQVARTRSYLRWRYENHPDFDYDFFVVSEWGIPCGWWLARRNSDVVRIGDAMFRSRSEGAPRAGLQAMLRAYAAEAPALREVSGWFSRAPRWWNEILDELEFAREKEPEGLHFCVKSFASGVSAEDIAENFYFTLGDGDMF